MSKLKTIALAAGFTAFPGTPSLGKHRQNLAILSAQPPKRLFKINRNAKLMLYQIRPFVSEPSAMKLKTSNTPQNH